MGFQQGLSGLNATSKNLEVIGNNVANANTYGAKSSRAEFADMYAGALGNSGNTNIGIGVRMQTVAQQFTQGTINATDNSLDVAINGTGFFQVKDSAGTLTYSRNGQFKLDSSGFIVNNSGQKLQGYQADTQGAIVPGAASALQLPTAGINPRATDNITLQMNLDSRSATTQPAVLAARTAANAVTAQATADAAAATATTNYNTAKAASDAAPANTTLASATAAALTARDAAVTSATNAATLVTTTAAAATAAAAGPQVDFDDPKTYNNATSLTAYDVKGQPVALTYYYQKSAPETWNVYVTANGESISKDASGNAIPFTAMTFPSTGGAPTTPASAVPMTIPATTNADGSTTEPITGISLDVSKTTQYGASFSVTDAQQTGYAPGQLTGLNIEQGGVITARYSNGLTKSAGQIELATFRNPQGLQALGGNVWAPTYGSGSAVVGTPGSGSMGALQSGALEESNVDLTSELVNMITAQRIYQANAQTIKTEDSILQTLVSLR